MHHFYSRAVVVAIQPAVLGSLFVKVNKPSSCIKSNTFFYYTTIILYTHSCVSLAFACFAMLSNPSLLQDFAVKRSQTDEKVSQRDEWYPKIPCRSEDQQEQSVDSFQLAKT